MKWHLQTGKKGFTLAEIIASIALIAVVGVFLAQMFALSDRLTEKASATDRAVTLCTSIADRWKTGGGAERLDEIPEIAGYVQTRKDYSFVPVDASMSPCIESQAEFVLEIVITETPDSVFDMRIRVLKAESTWKTGAVNPDDILYKLETSRYFIPIPTGDGS